MKMSSLKYLLPAAVVVLTGLYAVRLRDGIMADRDRLTAAENDLSVLKRRLETMENRLKDPIIRGLAREQKKEK